MWHKHQPRLCAGFLFMMVYPTYFLAERTRPYGLSVRKPPRPLFLPLSLTFYTCPITVGHLILRSMLLQGSSAQRVGHILHLCPTVKKAEVAVYFSLLKAPVSQSYDLSEGLYDLRPRWSLPAETRWLSCRFYIVVWKRHQDRLDICTQKAFEAAEEGRAHRSKHFQQEMLRMNFISCHFSALFTCSDLFLIPSCFWRFS